MFSNWYVKMMGVAASTGFLVFGINEASDKALFRVISSAFTDFYAVIMILLLKGGTILLSFIPTMELSQYAAIISTVVSFGVTMNSFFPVVESITLLLMFTNFRLAVGVIYFIKSMIPGMGK